MPKSNESTQAILASSTHAEYQPPQFNVISLDCEISAYAPDDGDGLPLF